MNAAARLALAGLLSIAVPRHAAAQTPARTAATPEPATGRQVEIAAGVNVLAPVGMGSQPLTLPNATGGAFTVAQITSRTNASLGIQAQIGFRLVGNLRASIAAGWSRVRFQSTITGDVEGAADTVSSMSVSRFTIGGDAILPIRRGGRQEVFALAGVNWLRESSSLSAGALYKDGSLVDTGLGVKLWLHERAKGRIRRLGVQLEGRFGIRTGGITLDSKNVHIAPSFLAGFVFGT